jgi:serine/threonine-protein kinase
MTQPVSSKMTQKPPPIPPAELRPGTRLLDRYVIIDRVASGGMATIHRAHDERLDRIVCVKLLRLVLERSGSTGGERSIYQATYEHFLQEAMSLSRLQHPNTLRIYDFGYLAANGRPFQISEFLDGGNLEQYVRERGPLSVAEMLATLEPIAGAIAEAHEQRIVHRDIKPSNILFSRIGDRMVPKLADFGIARSELQKRPRVVGDGGEYEEPLPPSGPKTISSIALFSARWAAPEQICGGRDSEATDVYALALVVVYMLTGHALFDDPDVRTTFHRRISGNAIIEERLARFTFPGAVHAVLEQALLADPSSRTSSPLVFFDSLRRSFLVSQPSVRQAAPAPEQASEPESLTLAVASRAAPRRAPRRSENTGDASDSAQEVLVSASEQALQIGNHLVRCVEVDEKLEISLRRGDAHVRFRATMIPAGAGALRLNIKPLNCFVAKPGGPPSPAIAAHADGAAEFVSLSKAPLGGIVWSFGRPAPRGAVFRLPRGELLVPCGDGSQAVAIDLGAGRAVIVMVRRPSS